MTTVESIAWTELLKATITTAQHGNDGNRIATATETLQQTAHQFVKVLNERAKLLANSAQFERALRDAAAIRTISPGSGFGYLCMGDVYCQQGHHAAAISIYDRGLEAVPESDAYYHQLQQHRMTAINISNKRVDFISQLPLDIVIINIIPRIEPKLYSHSLYGPLYVSRTWRERFLQHPDGLDYHFDDAEATFKAGHDQLVRFAPYVQSLDVSMKDVDLDELFSRAHFSSLKVLDIMCNPSTPFRPLISGLQMIADSLTHLYIMDGHCLELCDILESCPNLVSLSMDEVGVDVPLPPSARYPKLTHLAIHNVSDIPLDDDAIEDILSRLPSLLSFEITPKADSSLLPILHELCPYLQRLYFGDRSFRADKIDVHPNRKGITLARFHGFKDFYVQDHLIQFFLTHRNTLETFDCDGDIIRHYDALWELSDGRILQIGDRRGKILENDPTQSDTSLIRLASIRFAEFCSSSCNPFISWIVLNAPNLTTISIKESLFQPEIANVMTKSKKLSKLEITRPWEDQYIFGEEDNEGIVQFLEYHIAMGDQSTLQEITICTGMSLTISETSISRIARLPCLKTLELIAYHIPKECTSALAGCSSLQKLTLGGRRATFADDLMMPLSTLPNLKCLRIRAESLSEVDLVALTTFPRLEQLYLECAVPDSIMARLRKHIPKIIIQ
ncbi:hypothetical protein O0I10_011970 [Lichtheimia ornata]|uniref:F-box domain-containing protein n=1 Tax=Lichtheimia ornata TaxID=688661 RepID=A0AAD7USG1_9FUNG|nr:uncharacterized protein O0I10_011970 [Lichtheimia ornata]KAJ8652390.1 hypothetical protein O0I10_011970 [Lichtheimia ornata]